MAFPVRIISMTLLFACAQDVSSSPTGKIERHVGYSTKTFKSKFGKTVINSPFSWKLQRILDRHGRVNSIKKGFATNKRKSFANADPLFNSFDLHLPRVGNAVYVSNTTQTLSTQLVLGKVISNVSNSENPDLGRSRSQDQMGRTHNVTSTHAWSIKESTMLPAVTHLLTLFRKRNTDEEIAHGRNGTATSYKAQTGLEFSDIINIPKHERDRRYDLGRGSKSKRILEMQDQETPFNISTSLQPVGDGSRNNTSCPLECECHTLQTGGFLTNCSNKKLTKIPSGVSVWTVELTFRGNRIREVGGYAFRNLVNLRTMDMSWNLIDRLDGQSFNGLSNLTYLSLDVNNISSKESLTDDVFIPLQNLRELHLDGNCNMAVTPNCSYYDTAISHAPSVEVLSMDGLKGPLGFGFTKLRSLHVLSFGEKYCWMGAISSYMFYTLRNSPLVKLELRKCHIQIIEPNSFSSLKYLKGIAITDNGKLCADGLRNLTIGLNMTNIKRLILSNNCDSEMKFESNNYLHLSNTSLEYLDLGSCNIEWISAQLITHLPLTLKYLILRDNRILRRVPNIILVPLLVGLEYLDISLQSHFTHRMKLNIISRRNNILMAGNHVGLITIGRITNKRRSLGPVLTPTRADVLNGSVKNLDYIVRDINESSVPWPNPIMVPPHLKFLNMSFLKLLEYSIPAFNLTMKNEVENIDSSNNMLSSIDGKLEGFHHLKTLNFSRNLFSFIHPEAFGDMKRLKVLNLGTNAIGRENIDESLFLNLTILEYIDLSCNGLKTLPRYLFSPLQRLRFLFLKNNSLESVLFTVDRLKQLEILDLSNNQITDLLAASRTELDDIANKHSLKVYLEGNNLLCKCDQQGFIAWLSKTKVKIPNLKKMQCTFLNGSVLSLSHLDEINYTLEVNCFAWIVTLSCSILFVCLLIVFSFLAVLHTQRWKMKYLFYIGKRKVNPYHAIEDEAVDLQNDVYISFNEESESFYDFVTRKVYIALKERGLKVKIRNEMPGGRRLNAVITSAIRHSKKVIVFLTPGYCKEFWNLFEFNAAAFEGIYTKRNIIIPIIVGTTTINDLHGDVKAYLQGETVFRYTSNFQFSDFINELERKVRE